MKKNPLFVAVSNQKGGVGKSTMLVTLASLLSYSMDRNIAIVDCDSTQRSLFNLRERDMEMVEKNITDLSFCTPSGVSIRFTSSGFPL